MHTTYYIFAPHYRNVLECVTISSMTYIHPQAYFGDKIVPIEDAHLSVASSAVLYGLSVYTVFPVMPCEGGVAAFCLKDHYDRLRNSAQIIGIDTFLVDWNVDQFKKAVEQLVYANQIVERTFVRATIHVSQLVPGTRSRGLETILSMFAYEAYPIIPQEGVRLKTSVWRRVPDYAIPSRAKVNGAYVNSVLGKQDALDSGYDDCLFLDASGHVCELSAANIFIIRNGTLITPSPSSDILEGINRKIVLEIAHKLCIPIQERTIDLTEVYIADEAFACGTSSYIAPILQVDARTIGSAIGPLTQTIRDAYNELLGGKGGVDTEYLTLLNTSDV